MLRVLIVEDEKNASEALSNMLKLFLSNIDWVASCGTIEEAVALIKKNKPNILLLDVVLGKDNGFDIFKHFPLPDFKVIFVTAHENYAAKAFRFAAVDYLVKPVDPELLVSAIQKIYCALDYQKMPLRIEYLLHDLVNKIKNPKKLVLRTSDNIHVVDVSEIMYCEADRSYTNFHLADKTRILISNTMGDYEELLDESNFVRIHQSYLVNLAYLKRFEKSEGGKVILKNGISLPVATRKKEFLLQKLSNI